MSLGWKNHLHSCTHKPRLTPVTTEAGWLSLAWRQPNTPLHPDPGSGSVQWLRTNSFTVSPSFSSIPHPVVDVCIAMLPWISPEGFIATIWHRLPVSTQKYPHPSSQQFQIMHLYNMLVHDHAEAQHTLLLFALSCQLLFTIPNCETKHSHEGTVTTNFASFSSWSSL